MPSDFAARTDYAADDFHRIDLGVFLLEIDTCLWDSQLTFHDPPKNYPAIIRQRGICVNNLEAIGMISIPSEDGLPAVSMAGRGLVIF
jgi:hypothetical protein